MNFKLLATTWLASLLSLQLSATTVFAQNDPVDTDAINREASEVINTAYNAKLEARRAKRSKAWKNFLAGFDNAKFGIGKSTVANRKLTELDVPKKNLIRCVDRILDRHAGGYNGPALAQGFLLQAMDETTWLTDGDAIQSAADSCWDTYQKLDTFPNRAIDDDRYWSTLISLKSGSEAKNKTALLLGKLYSGQVINCESLRAEAFVGMGPGIELGIGRIRCQMTDGRNRIYLGPSVGLAGGFGASAGVERQSIIAPQGKFETLVGFSNADNLPSSYQLLVLNKAWPAATKPTSTPVPNFHRAGFGLEGRIFTVTVGAALRFFNAPRNWGMLIDSLN